MAKKEERFEVIFRDGSSLKDDGVRQILVDKETGVNYLCWKSGYGAGITPLLDSEGKQFSNLGIYELNVIDTTTHSIKDTVSAVKEKIVSGTALLYCELDGRKSHNIVV